MMKIIITVIFLYLAIYRKKEIKISVGKKKIGIIKII